MMFEKYRDCQPRWPSYNPQADFDWIQSYSKLPWLQLSVDIPYQLISHEIGNIQSMMSAHRDTQGEHRGWYSFCIHGKSYASTREDSYYNDTRPHVWTPEAESLMPKTVEYFKTQWPATQFFRLRVMLLEPGGYITVHSDSDKSQLWAINIAITQPVGCNFLLEKHGIIPFEPGSAYWLDLSNRHVVFNDSKESRWHIIVHQSFDNQIFQNMVVNSYKKLYNN